jgi:hypothetical protein
MYLGKSAFANSIIGRPFEDTESTVGINQLTCDIKYASIGHGDGWAECSKPDKELESAVASMIAKGIKPEKVPQKKGMHGGSDDGDSTTGERQTEGGGEGNINEGFDIRSRIKKVALSKVINQHKGSSDINVHGETREEIGPVGKYMDENVGGEVDEDHVELKESDAKAYDDELIMKCLADKVQTESKFVISVFDFGGQSVFNVSSLYSALELF